MTAGMTAGLIVLVVDDDPMNRKLLRANFEHEHAAVVEAPNGAVALGVLARQPVDLVVSDIHMPDMTGYDLCREWRLKDPDHRVPVILFSSTEVTPPDSVKQREVGADSFLKKPVSFSVLLKTFQDLLARRASHGRA